MILLVGAGSIGKRHLRNLIQCGVREFLIVDPRADRRQEAERFAQETVASTEGPQAGNRLTLKSAASLEEAIARGEALKALVIGTPPLYHPEAIELALKTGLPIFCEKPLAKGQTEWGALKRLVERAEKENLLGMVAYNYRFSPQLAQVRQMLQEGAVGRILSVRGTFSENLREWHPWEGLNFYMSSPELGGGALLDESHLIDIARWLFGEITEVLGYNGTLSSLQEEAVFKADDFVEILVRFHSGAIGSLHMDLFGKYHQKRLEIIGEEATLFWNFDNTDIESNGIQLWKGQRSRISSERTRRLPEQVIASDGLVRNHMYREEIRYFLEAKKAGRHLRPDVPDLRDGLQTLAVVRAVREAARSRQTASVEQVISSLVASPQQEPAG